MVQPMNANARFFRRVLPVALLLCPGVAYADMGLPMVAVFLPPMWLALPVVVLVEAVVLSRMLSVGMRSAIRSAAAGNLVSTFLGVPLAWLVLAVAELYCCGSARGLSTIGSRIYAVTVQAPWLIPYEGEFWWMVPCALVVLGLLFWLVSTLVEAPFNRWLLAPADPKRIWRATLVANAWSYVALGVLIWPIGALFGSSLDIFTPVTRGFVDITFRILGVFLHHGH